MNNITKIVVEGEGAYPWYNLERKIEQIIQEKHGGKIVCKGCKDALICAKGTALGAKKMALYFYQNHLVGWEVLKWEINPFEEEGYYAYP